MLFPIFYAHMTVASHRCWNVFVKKGVFLAAEAWRRQYGRAVRHAALQDDGGEILPEFRVPLFEGCTMSSSNVCSETATLFMQLLLRPIAVTVEDASADVQLVQAFLPLRPPTEALFKQLLLRPIAVIGEDAPTDVQLVQAFCLGDFRGASKAA